MGWELASENRANGTVPPESPEANRTGKEARGSLANRREAQNPLPASDYSAADIDLEINSKGKTSGRAQKPERAKRKHGCLFKSMVAMLVVLGLLAILVAASRCQQEARQVERENAVYTWPTSGLATLLPQPESANGEIGYDSDSWFSVDVMKTDETAYKAYIEACKEEGFDQDVSERSSRFEAYDKTGACLTVSYYASSSQMDIHLYAGREMGTITWPTSSVATSVPIPENLTGEVSSDKSSSFVVYLSMDKDAYNQYVSECIEAGFDVDYDRSDTRYAASNANGVRIEVSYEKGCVACLSVKADEGQTSAKGAAPATSASEPAGNAGDSSGSTA